jgi:hypothetical protein
LREGYGDKGRDGNEVRMRRGLEVWKRISDYIFKLEEGGGG